jgi:hypothetical protein
MCYKCPAISVPEVDPSWDFLGFLEPDQLKVVADTNPAQDPSYFSIIKPSNEYYEILCQHFSLSFINKFDWTRRKLFSRNVECSFGSGFGPEFVNLGC